MTRSFYLVLLAGAACGCAKASAPAGAPAPYMGPQQQPAYEVESAPQEPAPADEAADDWGEESSPETLPEATARFEQAQRELDQIWGAPARKYDQANTAHPEASAPAAPDCGSACRAFRSLRRSANAICNLAGENSQRCARARDIVATNERRVSGCGCATN